MALCVSAGLCASDLGTGTGLSWEYNASTHQLIISYSGEGTGVIPDYASYSAQPWSAYYYMIQTLVLPESGLKKIGKNAFNNLTAITSVTIPAGVESIGESSFKGCFDLTTVTFPSSLESIGKEAFANCMDLVTVTVPTNSLKSIDENCFEGCKKIETITLPNTLESIGKGAFYNCAKLTALTIPASVTSIGEGITVGCKAMTTISVDANNTVYESPSGSNAIVKKASPSTLVAGCKATVLPVVNTIATKAFGEIELSEINIPNGVARVEYKAFYGITGNPSMSVPASATYMSTEPFDPVNGPLSSVTVHEDNPNYDSRNNCNAIIEKASNALITGSNSCSVIPDGVISVESFAFQNCTGVTSITIPSSIQYLRANAFDKCTGLTQVICLATTPPAMYKNGGSGDAFRNVDKSIPVYVPASSVAAYQNNGNPWFGFTNIQAYEEPTLEWTCGTCTVTLIDGELKVFPTDGISGTMSYATSNYEENHPWLAYSSQVTKIVVADGVTNIWHNTFRGCSNATSARIGNDVIYIGYNAFNGCSGLTNITLPNKISSIDQDAFKGCTGMTDVYCYLYTTRVGGNWFDENADDFKASKATQCHVYADDLSEFLDYWGSDGTRDHLNLTFVGDLGGILTLGDSDNAGAIDEFLDAHDGEVIPELTIDRVVYRNQYYNTICLPFSMDATQIANSSIAGAEIREFVGAEVVAGALNLSLDVVTTIEKGKPYFISYSNAAALDELSFKDVQLDANEPDYVERNGVKFQGTYHGFDMPAQTEENHSYLFLGQNNTLYWPSSAGKIKPFRCYFIIPTGGAGAPIRRGMPAYLIDLENTATNVESIEGQVMNGKVQKVIENGVMYIIRNGEKYNVMGQIIK